MSEPLFYLRDARSNVGSTAMFWNKGEAGYGSDLRRLEVYTLEQAQSRHDSRHSDVPLLKPLVDELSELRVDHQHLPKMDTPSLATDCNEFVIIRKGQWDGNDVPFAVNKSRAGLSIGLEYNFKLATVFTRAEAVTLLGKEFLIYPRSVIGKLARPTFQASKIRKIKMTAGAGIKVNRPKLRRYITGKTRHNCPDCGRIVWDHNPYESAYCDEHRRFY